MNNKMKILAKIGFGFALLNFSMAQSIAQAEVYNLDQSHTTIGFKIKHLVISTVNGRFNQAEGSANYDEKSGKLENLIAVVQTKSIDTNDSKRDEHLRSKDFFDVEKFPILEFKSTKTEYKDGKAIAVEGNLKIHGVTKPVKLELSFGGVAIDPWNNKRMAFTAKGKINRKDFGLVWNKALEAGGVVVADEVLLEIDCEAIAKVKK